MAEGGSLEVPIHLRNAPTGLAKSLVMVRSIVMRMMSRMFSPGSDTFLVVWTQSGTTSQRIAVWNKNKRETSLFAQPKRSSRLAGDTLHQAEAWGIRQMMWLSIALGGALGASLRHGLTLAIPHHPRWHAMATLVVNVLAA